MLILIASLGAYCILIPADCSEANTPCMDIIEVRDTSTKYCEVRATIREEKVKGMRVIKHKGKSSKKGSKRVRGHKQKVNKYEKYLLAKLIYCEVGNVQDDKCLELCGSVVLNRIKDKRYPDTMEGVIFQKGQYEVTWNGHWSYKEPDNRCLRIARKLLKYGSIQKDVNAMSERVWGKYYCRFGNVIFSIC